MDRLRRTLHEIDGASYGAYRRLPRVARAEGLELRIIHVQGDPFAAPSRVGLIVDAARVGLPSSLRETRARRVASEDFLLRRVAAELPKACPGTPGSGKSGKVFVDRPGQEVLERTACTITADGRVALIVEVGLPAQGRRVLGHAAQRLLTEQLPALCDAVLDRSVLDLEAMASHADGVEDSQALRDLLPEAGLVAFVAEGARLARRSGVDDRPLVDGIPFGPIPESFLVELSLPHAGKVRGLGLRPGLSLIVGGGYHGKSTLLEALARGIHDHVEGDGRERVVSLASTLGVRAEDGRRVEAVDIEAFIRDLPHGADTRRFSTDRASGSTSQAAAIVEGVEAGARVLLMDEDTSASNFLVRDHRMQQLVPQSQEPIRPFVDRVQGLHQHCGVSTVLVAGGSSEFFEHADAVIQMDAYQPKDAGPRVRELIEREPSARQGGRLDEGWSPTARRPRWSSLEPTSRRRHAPARVRAVETRAIRYGDEEIDLSLLSQLVDPGQVRTIADILRELAAEAEPGCSIGEAVAWIDERIQRSGLATFTERGFGNRAGVRGLDVACALNRLRSMEIEREDASAGSPDAVS